MKANNLYAGLASLLVTLAVTGTAAAEVVVGFSQDNLAAQVTFATQGTDLIATLENISTYDVPAPEEVLTGVFFTLHGLGTNFLTPEIAVLSDGSAVHFPVSGNGTDLNGQIGGEYGFRDDISGVPSGATMVISAVGMDDLIGPHDRFLGENLWGPEAPDGLGYGIVSAYDNLSSGNSKVTGDVPLVQDGVRFTLAGLPEGFVVEGNVADVMFNYGTAFNPVPAPGAFGLTVWGLAMIGWMRKRLS